MPDAIKKPAHEVALLLTLRRSRTVEGQRVQEHVLFRVECDMWINAAIKGE